MVGTSVPECLSIFVKQELLWISPFSEASHLLEKCVARQVKDGAHLKRKCSIQEHGHALNWRIWSHK